MPVILPEDRIIQQRQFLGLTVQLVVGILLQLVAEPCRHVPLLVSPGDRILDLDLGDRLVPSRGLGRSRELEGTVTKEDSRKEPHEIEYPRTLLLVLAEGLVVHEQVDDLPVGGLEP